MNIFALSKSPIESARQMLDKHVVKMPTETCQMLHTNILYMQYVHVHGKEPQLKDLKRFHRELGSNLMKPAMLNHPSTIWVRTTTANYDWMIVHALALCEEYTHRYGKVHASQSIIEWCADNIPSIPEGQQTKMPQCMPDRFKDDDSVTAYRHFYNVDKRNSFKCVWTNRREPNWWKNSIHSTDHYSNDPIPESLLGV